MSARALLLWGGVGWGRLQVGWWEGQVGKQLGVAGQEGGQAWWVVGVAACCRRGVCSFVRHSTYRVMK